MLWQQSILLQILAAFCLHLAEQSCIVQILLLYLHRSISRCQVLAGPGHMLFACQRFAGSDLWAGLSS